MLPRIESGVRNSLIFKNFKGLYNGVTVGFQVVRAKERIEMELAREAEAAAKKEQKKQEETQS